MARCKLRGLEDQANETLGIKEAEKKKREEFELHKKTPLIWVKTGTPDPKWAACRRYNEKQREKNPKKDRKLPGPRHPSGGLKKRSKNPITHKQRIKVTQNAIKKGFLNRGNPNPSPAT